MQQKLALAEDQLCPLSMKKLVSLPSKGSSWVPPNTKWKFLEMQTSMDYCMEPTFNFYLEKFPKAGADLKHTPAFWI